jgi:hypothetical protein
VLAASKLMGNCVRNSAGNAVGEIEDFMLDMERGRIAGAVLSLDGMAGLGEELFVPWSALQIDRGERERAPGFDKTDWPNLADPAFANQ